MAHLYKKQSSLYDGDCFIKYENYRLCLFK
nr:MAG TPA: hypothetical protein [Caudoviricetes sp.]